MFDRDHSLYTDHARVEELFVDTLNNYGLDRSLALRLSDGDADYPWPSLVRTMRDIALARGHSRDDEARGLCGIVADLVDSLHGQGDLDWLASTEHPGSLLIAHLHRLEREAL